MNKDKLDVFDLIYILSILFMACFTILKLTNQITISWLWILAPIIIIYITYIGILFILLIYIVLIKGGYKP